MIQYSSTILQRKTTQKTKKRFFKIRNRTSPRIQENQDSPKGKKTTSKVIHKAKKRKQEEAHYSEWSEQPRTPRRDLGAIATIAITQNRQFTKWLGFHKKKREMDMKSP